MTTITKSNMEPTPVIVATNYKGGVGKTTSSRVLAQAMCERKDFTKGKPVLIIDMDPQANTSSRWNLLDMDLLGNPRPIAHPDYPEETRSSISDLWLAILGVGETGYNPLPYQTSNPNIECLPAYEAHMLAANRLDDVKQNQMAQMMLEWLRGDEVAEKYSCVIIDTQPSKAPMINIALIAATHCYVPFIPEPQSIQGVYSIITYIANRQAHRLDNTELKILGCLPNMHNDRLLLHRNNLMDLRQNKIFREYVMPLELGRRTAYSSTDDANYTPGAVTEISGIIKAEAEAFADFVIKKIQPAQEATA